jgi:hypothetical protein
MLYKLAAYIHVLVARRARRIVAALEGQRGQGTVEYVGLILLVSLLMVGMVAAMKGFNGKQGTELADVIVGKIKQAVNASDADLFPQPGGFKGLGGAVEPL